jgi:hypothetical protein
MRTLSPKLLSNREKAEEDERSAIDSALFQIDPASVPDPVASSSH